MKLYQINSRILSKRMQLNLDCIDISYWQDLKNKGFNAVWLMGVWKICDYSIVESKKNFANYPQESIVGSCFAVDDYVPDTFIGNLLDLKSKLNSVGLKLILDFIPNHFGRLGSFFVDNPELFLRREQTINNTSETFQFDNQNYFLAKDPHYSPWSDVVQLDYSKPQTVETIQYKLIEISKLCDGVRCDMTMLILPEIFEQTWGKKSLDFWKVAIEKVKLLNPNFIFIAEVYWNLENRVIDEGFDLVYNKSFLDGLINNDQPKLDYAKQIIATGKSLIFLENHDEPRINSIFETYKVKELTDYMYSQNSSLLIQDGELDGQKIRLPIQVCL